jgi:hypothetical protein
LDSLKSNSNERVKEQYVTPDAKTGSGKNGQKKRPYVKLDPRVSIELSEDGSIKNRSPSS